MRRTLRPVSGWIAGSTVRVDGGARTPGTRSWPRLHGTSRKASARDNALFRSIETDAKRPAVVIFMQQTHELTSSQLHLILERGLEVKLHAVHGRLSRTSGSGNGGGTVRRARALTRANRVHTKLCAGRAGGHGRERHGPCEIKWLRGVILPHGCLSCQPYSSTCGRLSCAADGHSWRGPRRRIRRDRGTNVALHRADRTHSAG